MSSEEIAALEDRKLTREEKFERLSDGIQYSVEMSVTTQSTAASKATVSTIARYLTPGRAAILRAIYNADDDRSRTTDNSWNKPIRVPLAEGGTPRR